MTPDRAVRRGESEARTVNWRENARCRTGDPEMFFPSDGTAVRLIAEAKAVCAECPVVAPCLAYAERMGVEGVWGGRWFAPRYLSRDRRGAA